MINEILNYILKIALVSGLLALAYYLRCRITNDRYLIYIDIIQEITEINNTKDHEVVYDLLIEDIKDQLPKEIITYMKRHKVNLNLLIVSFLEKDTQITEI